MKKESRFSERHGLRTPDPEISVRDDAPQEFRSVLVDLAYESGLDPSDLRGILCRLLRVARDEGNWSEFPNIDGEVRGLLCACAWYHVYDVVELISARLTRDAAPSWARNNTSKGPEHFQRELNEYFCRRGFGWQLSDGVVQVRGPEAFEVALGSASTALATAGRPTAAAEIHQALADLSKRPVVDLTGALQHAIAALECVARDVAGNPNATLGALLSRRAVPIPAPVNQAIEKLWGYASERGRHLREGESPTREEVELVVHTAAAVATYLSRPFP